MAQNNDLYGATSLPHSPAELDDLGLAALEFVKDRVPNVGTLISFTRQFVAGMNYNFHFSDFNGAIRVYSRPWENNFLQITLPTGEEIRNH